MNGLLTIVILFSMCADCADKGTPIETAIANLQKDAAVYESAADSLAAARTKLSKLQRQYGTAEKDMDGGAESKLAELAEAQACVGMWEENLMGAQAAVEGDLAAIKAIISPVTPTQFAPGDGERK